MRRGGDQHIPRPVQWRLGAVGRWPVPRPLDVSAMVAAVRTAGLDGVPAAPLLADARESAVLVLLADGPDGAEVLLTKRSHLLRNHAGEISFPGGRLDAGESPEEAALREADEEVGLSPADVVVHGRLSHLSTVVSRSSIIPVVASVAARPALVPHDLEVARILWVPLAELASDTTYREEWWGTPPLDRRMDFFELDDETIWGATGRVLYELLCLGYGPPATLTAE